MNNIFEDLLWLPKSPQDFTQRLIRSSSVNDLRKLAKYSLDENQLSRLYKKFQLLQKEGVDLLPLTTMTIGIISNATTKLAVPALVATALRFGIALKVIEAEFDQIAQEAFSNESVFTDQNLNFILVAIDYHSLPLLTKPGNKDLAEKNILDCFTYVKSVVDSLHNKTKAQIILQNIVPPVEAPFGSFEGRLVGTLFSLISDLNKKLDTLINDSTFILDINSLASNLGWANWHDPTIWNIAKLSFPLKYLPIYAEYICRILSISLGKSRRCLILDLDNTLWGGVIGEDGLGGIDLGPTPKGRPFLEFQK